MLATGVEFWSAVVLDDAGVLPELFTPMFTCARVAGWSAHILEQKREARLVRPTAEYIGPAPRSLAEVGPVTGGVRRVDSVIAPGVALSSPAPRDRA